MKKGLLIIMTLGIFLILIIAIYFYYFNSSPRGIQIAKNTYPIAGIDISDQTGKVDIKKQILESIKFIFIKATQGQNFVDKQFKANYEWATLNNLPKGTYHLLSFSKAADVQVDNYLRQTKGKEFELPFVLDVESWLNPTTKSDKDIVELIREFLTLFKEKTGESMMIYANESDYKRFIENNFNENEIWICSFNNPPKINRKWTFWQHSHKGKFNFAPGWVDINTFNGNEMDWNNYILK